MEGDIIYVVREPLLFRSYSVRKTSRSTKLDQLIARSFRYRHYGVEVENNHVLHFISDSISCMDEGMIKKSTMEEFLKDGIKKVDNRVEYKFPREKVAQRAYSRLHTDFSGYKIYTNNCEHFATWCAMGSKISNQYSLGGKGKKIIMLPKKAKKKIIELFAVI